MSAARLTIARGVDAHDEEHHRQDGALRPADVHAAARAGWYSDMNLRTLASVSGHSLRPSLSWRTK